MAGDQQVHAAAVAAAAGGGSVHAGAGAGESDSKRELQAGASAPSPSPSSTSEHLSVAFETAIRLLPGNDRCVDCKAVYPQWAAVSFGVLVCLACAGQHRSLGVGVSFVKSLGMDSWSQTERRSLEVGGNAKWTAVCVATSTGDLPLAKKYTSRVAEAYRSRIQGAASSVQSPAMHTATEFLATLARASTPIESVVDSELPSPDAATPPVALLSLPLGLHDPSALDPIDAAPDALAVKCTTCQRSVPLEHLDTHSKACVVSSSASPAVAWRKYERQLGVSAESLGISLTKTRGGFAEVTRVTPGGEAEQLAVVVGSYVVGLNAVQTSAFEEIVALVRTLPRPIQFHFAVRGSATDQHRHAHSHHETHSSSSSRAPPPTVISSVPEPISVDIEITFHEHELGCLLQVRDFGCVVQHVDHGGAAHARGVLVGSRIVEVNGRRFVKPEDVIRAIQTSRRPMRVMFHRVEGLMRGWTRR